MASGLSNSESNLGFPLCEKSEPNSVKQNTLIDEVSERKNKRKAKPPLGFCEFIVNYPRLAFGLTLGAHVLFSGMNAILAATGYNIFPVEFENFPLQLRHTPVQLRDWAWRYRNEDPQKIFRLTVNNSDVNPVRGTEVDALELIYTLTRGRNVFTRDILKRLQHIEETLFNVSQYQREYCQLDTHSNCVLPKSLIRYFDGTHRDKSPVFYDPDFRNITAVIYTANNHPATHEEFQYHLTRASIIREDRVYAERTRTSFPMGWPIPGPGSSWDRQQRIGTFLVDVMEPRIQELSREHEQVMRINYISFRMFLIATPRAAFRDMALAFGSFIFIFGFIWFQTGTLWVSGWAIFSIVSCFFITNLIYRTVLDYQYFGYFHIIVIFIILGIGADDIFVFYNTWLSTGHEEYPSLAHRLSDCYRKSATTMFVTSLTTMAAFLANALSPLLPISSFGIFSGILVAVNYFSVIIFFPTVVMLYHYNYESYIPPCYSKCCIKSSSEDTKDKKPALVRFFGGPFFSFISHKVVRWVLVVVFLATAAFFSWSTSTLQPDSEQVKIYKDDTQYGEAYNLVFGNTFRPMGDDFIRVNIVWGLRHRNLSRCHFSDSRCFGNSSFDGGFDMNFPPVQLAVKELCHKLRHGLTHEQAHKLQIRNDTLTGERQIDCFLDNLEDYLRAESRRLEIITGQQLDLSLPLTETKIRAFMKAQDPELYNVSALPSAFDRYFEIAVGHWLMNGYSMLATPDYYRFNNLVGEIWDPGNTRVVNDIPPSLAPNVTGVGFEYGTRLRWAAVRVNLSISFSGLVYMRGIPVWQEWENFVKQETDNMPYPLKRGFQTNIFMWNWLFVQESLVINAVQGVIIGISIALPVLILATGNLIIGTFATVVICIITVCVIGVIPLAGWKLGVLTSLNLSLVVGLSVDYTIHLAEGYHMSIYPDRKRRVRDTLEHMGTSVISGAVTTLGASFFLFFGQIQFFLQFGAFMFSTIGFSMVFSLGFFTTVLALCGPENDTGSLLPLYTWIKYRVTGRGKDDTTCTGCGGKGFITHTDKHTQDELWSTDSASVPKDSPKYCLQDHLQKEQPSMSTYL